MRYITGTEFGLERTAVTLGKFDGLHLGHQFLLHQILKKNGLASVMFTFDLHPGNLFSEEEIKLIVTGQERVHYLEQLGLDFLVAYPFTRKTASMAPGEFIRQILVEKLGARLVVVGEDFHFGNKRSGDVAFLQEMSAQYGYEVISCPKVIKQGEVVSSTRIRNLIVSGNMEKAQELLGRPFSIEGRVIHGNHLGHTVGMPTANLRPPHNKLLPPNGVYAADIVLDGQRFRAITNVGYKPTVGGEDMPGVESWIFEFDQDIYEKEIRVELRKFIRPERRFDSLEEVKAQVEKDAKKALQLESF